MEDSSVSYNFLTNKIMRIVKSASSKNEKLQNICTILKTDIPYYNWVGFYIGDEVTKKLTLGPYVGAPTEHTKIPFGSGICGQAAVRKDTFIVQDVTSESNYLSCSPDVRAEIVIPVMKGGHIVAELDIDSHSISPFTDEDKKFLENVCSIVAQLF